MADEREVYNVSNPHPAFGKDPNIINEFGHTRYPRYVDHPTETFESKAGKHPIRVVVESKEEEDALLGRKEVKKEKTEKPEGWTK